MGEKMNVEFDEFDEFDEIDEMFDKVFDKENDVVQDESISISPMTKKLKQRKEHKMVNEYLSWLHTWDEAGEKREMMASSNNDIANVSYNHSLIDISQGKHFTEPVNKNYVTIIYEVFCSWSYKTKTKYYYVKKTDSEETVMPDGSKYVTYYIDHPNPNGNRIVFLHFNKSEHHMIINTGILLGDEIRVSKSPGVEELKSISSAKIREEDTFLLDNLTDAEKEDFLEGVSSFNDYNISVDSTIITIDTETLLPVPKKVYLENGEYKAKVTLKTGRTYFSFKIKTEMDTNLSDFEIAKGYLHGMGDFPQDTIKAAEMFEAIGDAESLYQLAHIWLDESNIDTDSLQNGRLYLEQAAHMGHATAKVELVYYTMQLLCKLPTDEKKELINKYQNYIKNAIDTGLPGSLFLAAYIYEKGLFVERNADLAFSYYFRAAQASHLAAKARIGLAPVGGYHDEDECRNYFNNSIGKAGLAEYFMGWFLSDDPDIMVVGDDILYFYELAANSGVTPAIKELAEVYISGNNYIEKDPAKAIMWYEKIDSIDDTTAVRLANYYLDGKGCTAGPESDAKAFYLLSETVKKYENGIAYNNLGWMYKTGRGCETPDLKHALSLFKRAAELKCGSAFYHLGDIYENGLGVERNIKTALNFYQQGVELENRKCIERLAELKEKSIFEVDNSSSLEQIISNQQQIKADLKVIDGRTIQIQNQLSQIIQFAENDLQKWLQHEKCRFVNSIDSDDEERISQSISRSNDYINLQVKNVDGLVDEKAEELRKLFGTVWDKLLPMTQTSLISAGVLWESCAGITKDDFDYSGICISSTSALECELRRWFYVGYQEYLLNTVGNPNEMDPSEVWDEWPEELLNTDKRKYRKIIEKGENSPIIELGDAKSFTLGKLPFLFYNEKSRGTREHMQEYLDTIFKKEYRYYRGGTIGAVDWIDFQDHSRDPHSFISECDNIRNDYRNPAAHSGIVCRNDAEVCYQRIIGRGDAYRHCSEVQGLIMKLYEYLDI